VAPIRRRPRARRSLRSVFGPHVQSRLSDLSARAGRVLPSRQLAVEFKTPRFDADVHALAERRRGTSRCSTREWAQPAVYDPREGRLSGRFYDETRTPSRVLHYGLDLSFDPERSWSAGMGAGIRILSASTQTLVFRLADSLNVAPSRRRLAPLASGARSNQHHRQSSRGAQRRTGASFDLRTAAGLSRRSSHRGDGPRSAGPAPRTSSARNRGSCNATCLLVSQVS